MDVQRQTERVEPADYTHYVFLVENVFIPNHLTKEQRDPWYVIGQYQHAVFKQGHDGRERAVGGVYLGVQIDPQADPELRSQIESLISNPSKQVLNSRYIQIVINDPVEYQV